MKHKLIYDGQCQFCIKTIQRLQHIDSDRLEYINYHDVPDLSKLHPSLTKSLCDTQMHLISPKGQLYGGFNAFKKLTLFIPAFYPWAPLVHLPGAHLLGIPLYQFIAKHRNSCSIGTFPKEQ